MVHGRLRRGVALVPGWSGLLRRRGAHERRHLRRRHLGRQAWVPGGGGPGPPRRLEDTWGWRLPVEGRRAHLLRRRDRLPVRRRHHGVRVRPEVLLLVRKWIQLRLERVVTVVGFGSKTHTHTHTHTVGQFMRRVFTHSLVGFVYHYAASSESFLVFRLHSPREREGERVGG